MPYGFKSMTLRTCTLERLRKIAGEAHRSPQEQIEAMLDTFEAMQIVNAGILPHPPDAEPVPLVTVKP